MSAKVIPMCDGCRLGKEYPHTDACLINVKKKRRKKTLKYKRTTVRRLHWVP